MIKGITVTLYEKTQTGIDDFGAPIYEETAIDVQNVLVGEPNGEDIISTDQLEGKEVGIHARYP